MNKSRIYFCKNCQWWEVKSAEGAKYGGTWEGCLEFLQLIERDNKRLFGNWGS